MGDWLVDGLISYYQGTNNKRDNDQVIGNQSINQSIKHVMHSVGNE